MEFMSWEKQPPLVGSSRMTGMSFTSEEAFFKRLSPVHFKLLERSGGAAPCLERASLCMWPWLLCVSVSFSVSGKRSVQGVKTG